MKSIEELIEEKRKNILTDEESEKMKLIDELVLDKSWAFKTNSNTVAGILSFLGVPQEELEKYYLELVSPKNFMNVVPKTRDLLDGNEITR